MDHEVDGDGGVDIGANGVSSASSPLTLRALLSTLCTRSKQRLITGQTMGEALFCEDIFVVQGSNVRVNQAERGAAVEFEFFP